MEWGRGDKALKFYKFDGKIYRIKYFIYICATKYKLSNFMKLQKFLLVCGIAAVAMSAQAQSDKSGYPITPVPFTSVKVTPNTFWGQRLKASR